MSPSDSAKTEQAEARRPWWRRVSLWPKSLAGQLIAALLIALVVAQIISISLFAYERSNIAVTTTRGQVLDRTAVIIRFLNQTDESWHRRVVRAAEGPGLLYSIRNKTNLTIPTPGSTEAKLAARLEKNAGLDSGTVRISKVKRHLFQMKRVQENDDNRASDKRRPDYTDKEQRGRGPRWREGGPEGTSDGSGDRGKRGRYGQRRPNLVMLDMTIAVPMENGKWLHVRTGLAKPPVKWGQPFLISLCVMAAMILLIVVLTVRKLTAPLRALEGASRRLGRGETVEPLAEKGPKEVRGAIIAFNTMQDRLMRFVQDRTRMLAAVSHDLRTPITTLRLRAEFIDDDEIRDKILETLEEMQAMTNAVLAFAREDATSEETRDVDLAALLSSVADDYAEMGKEVNFDGPDSLIYSCRVVSLKRAIRNLTENALRYAGDATISLATGAKALEISVADTGPGIPEDKLEEAFAPFFRVEGSRNLETGGVGLGLSITRTIIRSHGGDVTISNRPEGGLIATITLPL